MHIKQIRLQKSSVESKVGDVPAISPLQHGFDAVTTVDKENGSLSVLASLSVRAGDVLKIDAEFVLDYLIDKPALEMPGEVTRAFGRMSGIHNVWPFWREYVHSMSMRTGLPPVVLPLVTHATMLAYYAKKEEEVAISTVQRPQRRRKARQPPRDDR